MPLSASVSASTGHHTSRRQQGCELQIVADDSWDQLGDDQGMIDKATTRYDRQGNNKV